MEVKILDEKERTAFSSLDAGECFVFINGDNSVSWKTGANAFTSIMNGKLQNTFLQEQEASLLDVYRAHICKMIVSVERRHRGEDLRDD